MLCHIAGVQEGDEVITSPISFVATANCFIFEGGRPVFADVDPQTLNLDPAAVEAAITERTKGIVAVDMFGYPCELDELRAIAERHGLWLIDDSCEALGAEYKGRPIGSHGLSGAFGFYPNKQITTGEGGVVTTHSEEERELLEEPPQPGPLVRDPLVPPRAARVQLPVHRPAGRGRDRPAREARRDPRACGRGRGAVRRAARGRRRRRAAASPTTPTTSARGSST